jgi:Protein of unknown function (DUF1566)
LRTVLRHLARWLGPALALAGAAAWAADGPGPAKLGLSEDGAYVLDARAQVAWPRCVQGMQWNGKTCLGKPLLLNHGEAMALARDLGKDRGLDWRVPRVMQLQSLVHKANSPPGLDPHLFPAAPGGWHWSATSSVDTERVNQYDYGNIVRGRTEQNANHTKFLHGWAVDLSTGEARADVTKRTKLPVRLVLPLD